MGVCSSIGSVVDACDNAMAERIFARLECEFIAGHSWKTKTEARRALITWIETTLCGAVSDCDNIKSIEKTGGNIISSLLAATGKKNRYEPHLEKMQGTKFPREGL